MVIETFVVNVQILGVNMEDFAGMNGIEYLLIGEKCDLTSFRNELKWNELYFHLYDGIK